MVACAAEKRHHQTPSESPQFDSLLLVLRAMLVLEAADRRQVLGSILLRYFHKSMTHTIIKNCLSEQNSTLLQNLSIRDAKIGHVANLIGRFQNRVKFYAENSFIGSGPAKLLTREDEQKSSLEVCLGRVTNLGPFWFFIYFSLQQRLRTPRLLCPPERKSFLAAKFFSTLHFFAKL